MTALETAAQNTFNLVNNLYTDYQTKLAKVKEWQKLLDTAVNTARNKETEYQWSLENKTASEIQGFRDSLNSAYASVTALSDKLKEAQGLADTALSAYTEGKATLLTQQEQLALEATLGAQATQSQAEADAAAAAAVKDEAQANSITAKTKAETDEEIKRKKMISTILWVVGSLILGAGLSFGGWELYKKIR